MDAACAGRPRYAHRGRGDRVTRSATRCPRCSTTRPSPPGAATGSPSPSRWRRARRRRRSTACVRSGGRALGDHAAQGRCGRLVDECSAVAAAAGRGQLRREPGRPAATGTTPTAPGSWPRWPGGRASIRRAALPDHRGRGGGPGRRVALAGRRRGRVAVVNRTAARAVAVAALAGRPGRARRCEPGRGDVAQADLVVNATPVAWRVRGRRVEGWLVAPSLLHRGQVVADLIYAPRPTAWLAAAAETGATTVDGLGMLVHQAAAQLELWTGLPAPVDVMWRAAVRRRLSRRAAVRARPRVARLGAGCGRPELGVGSGRRSPLRGGRG